QANAISQRNAKVGSFLSIPVTDIGGRQQLPDEDLDQLSLKQLYTLIETEPMILSRDSESVGILEDLVRLTNILLSLGAITSDFSGIYCEGCRFAGAELVQADFRNAFLSRADFTGAHLANANLSNADLGGAIFYNADLTKANMRSASAGVSM